MKITFYTNHLLFLQKKSSLIKRQKKYLSIILLLISSCYYSFTSKTFCESVPTDLLTSYPSLIDYATPTATKNYYIENDVAKRASLVNSIGVENSTYHLLTHGKPGTLLIEGQWKNASEIAAWIQNKQLLKDKTHLNIYGCNFAQGEKGQQAVSVLETMLAVSIAASDDITGVDGDWELEVGDARNAIVLEEYEYNLQACNCKEFIYLNEPSADAVLKFEIDPDITPVSNTASLIELPNAECNFPFIKNNTLIPNPHGVTIDPNGNLWVGSTVDTDNPIRKFNCGGEYIGDTAPPVQGIAGPNDITNNAGSLTNLFYANGFLYGNSAQSGGTSAQSGGPTKFDPCTGEQIGSNVCLNDAGNGFIWGMWYDEMTGYVYTTAQGVNAAQGLNGDMGKGLVYRYTLAEVDSAVNNGMCFDPIIAGVFSNADDSSINRLFGITTDFLGNIYVVGRKSGGSGDPAQIFKYDSMGNFLGKSPINTTIYPQMMGLVYSMTTNRLYASTANEDGQDCIAVFDTNLNYEGTGALNSDNSGGRAGKGIAIIKECCPLAGEQTFNYSYCAEDFPAFLEISKLYECEGIVCEAPWVIEADAMGITYDSCRQAIIELSADFELTGGCVTFTKEWEGGTLGKTTQCDPYKITINIEIVAKAKSTISSTTTICEGDSVAITSVTTNPGEASDMVAYQWQVSPTSSGVFVDIPGATSPTYTPTPSATQCFRLITTTTGSCVAAPDNAMCSDTSNIVKFTINPAPTLMTIDTAVCSGTMVDVTASVFSTGSPTGGDLSYQR